MEVSHCKVLIPALVVQLIMIIRCEPCPAKKYKPLLYQHVKKDEYCKQDRSNSRRNRFVSDYFYTQSPASPFACVGMFHLRSPATEDPRGWTWHT